MMGNRKAKTQFLSKLLVSDRLNQRSKYWAKEVTLDYGLKHHVRVDFMQFVPENQIAISGLEKGIFICYEIKSCKADFNSGHGLNFEGEMNYIVTTIECYKQIVNDIPWNVGVMVAIPFTKTRYEEFDNPTPLPQNYDECQFTQRWRLEIIKRAHKSNRKRSTIELLFCMLRAGR